MSFLPLFKLQSGSSSQAVPVHSSLPITPHSLQPHQMLFWGQGFVKLSKVQEMLCFCPGSTPQQTACPQWGAAGVEERFCRAERENEAGRKSRELKGVRAGRLGEGCPEGFGITRCWARGGERVCVKSEWGAVSGTWQKKKKKEIV